MIPQIVLVALLSASVWPDLATASLETLCEGIRFATLPHPADCRQYVICSQGLPNVQQCPKDTVFNPTVLFCVLEAQYTCSVPTTPAQPESPSPTEPPALPSTVPTTVAPGCADRPTWESFFCEDVRRPLVANPMNCTQYISCSSSPARNRHCPPGTIYSDPYLDCFPGDARACSVAGVSEGFCAARADGSYAHPFQCNRFVSCVRQQVRLEACPPFFVFSPAVAHCVPGNAASCSSLLNQ